MPLNQLDVFMAAMRRLESGSFEGNYRAQNVSGARGAYQIMTGNWASWASQAGVPGADWRDPAAQDAVARYKMTEYYRRFNDWNLVAIAWFAGPGAAASFQRGDRRILNRSDGNTTVSGYLKLINNYMDEFSRRTGSVDPRAFQERRADEEAAIRERTEFGMTSVDSRAGWMFPMYLDPNDYLAQRMGPLGAPIPPSEPTGPSSNQVLTAILQRLSDGVKRSATSSLGEAPPSDRIDLSTVKLVEPQ